MKCFIKVTAGACAAGLLSAACATTGSSSASTFGGLLTNFKPAYETFEGQYISTIDYNKAEIDQTELDEERLSRLALSADPKTAHGSAALVQASMWSHSASQSELVMLGEPRATLEKMLDDIIQTWDGERPEIAVVVVADDSLRGTAHPENFITFPMGALTGGRLTNDGEIAALLAHEAAHILLGHHRRAETMDSVNQARRVAQELSSSAVFINEAKYDRNHGLYASSSSMQEKSRKFELATMLAQEVSNTWIGASMSREQEDHADLLAIDLLARAGYNPNRMVDYLEKLESTEQAQAKQIEELTAEEEALTNEYANAAGVDTSSFFGGLTSQIAGMVYKDMHDRAKKSHRDTASRLKAARAYTQREYGNAGNIQISIRGERHDYFNSLQSGLPGQVIDAYRASFEAEKYIGRGEGMTDQGQDVQKAYTLARRGVTGPTEMDSYPRLVLAKVRWAQGDREAALENLRLARQSGRAVSANLLRKMATYQIDMGRYEAAEQSLLDGVRLIETPIPFYYERINLAARQRDEEKALALYDECAALEENSLTAKCRQALGPELAKMRPELGEGMLQQMFGT